MKTLFFFVIIFLISAFNSFSQIMPLTLEPDGDNKKASVSEQIGIVKISILYSRPGVKGREGKIWNTPVAYYGFTDPGHGTSNAAPWRVGANENTAMSFSHPVKVEGKELPAGTYGYQSVFDLKINNRINDAERGFRVLILESSTFLLELIENKSWLDQKKLLADKPAGTRIQGFFKIGFKVPDMDACIKHLAGLKIIPERIYTDSETKKRNFLINDPDGNLVQFFE